MTLEDKIQAIMEGKDLEVIPASVTDTTIETPQVAFDQNKVDAEDPKQEVEDPTKGDSDEEEEQDPVVSLENPLGVNNSEDDLDDEDEDDQKKSTVAEQTDEEVLAMAESFVARDGKVSVEAVIKLAREMFPGQKVKPEHLDAAKAHILKNVGKEQIAEMAMDTLKHPTHGDLSWENNGGEHQIKKAGRVVYTGSHEEVAKRWNAIKKTVEESTALDEECEKMLSEATKVEESAEELLATDAHLTEEYKAKAKELFESEVQAKVESAKKLIESEYAEKLATILEEVDAEKKEFMSKISENIDNHLETVSEQWVVDNKVVLETKIQVENAQSLMNGLKSLFEQHNLILPEGGRDVVQELQTQVNSLSEQLQEKSVALEESQTKLVDFARNEILNEVCKGLTELDQSRLKTLVEDVDFTDADSFKDRVKTLRENVFVRQQKQEISESFISDEKVNSRSPVMQAYLDALTGKRNKVFGY